MTDDVLASLQKNHICIVNVPPKHDLFLQPLVLTVNGHTKKYMKNKFNNCYNSQIAKQRDGGVNLFMQDGWLVELCNHMMQVKGKYIIASV